MSLSLDDARKYLPQYLSPADTAELFSELSRLPRIPRFFGQPPDADPLQGDIWEHVSYYNHVANRVDPRRVMIVSNSCNVAAGNDRQKPVFISYSPILRLSRFEQLLAARGASAESIGNTVLAIRQQESTTAFFVPAGGILAEDSVVLLDDIQSQPLYLFVENAAKRRIATLSQSAFWLLVLKVSIHFCRSFESFARGHTAPVP